MVVFTTSRSGYALDAARGLLLQLPGGTPCGLRPGVWHRVAWPRHPVQGERFFCFVTPYDGGEPLPIRTGEVTWVSPAAPSALAAAATLAAAAS